MTIRPRSSLRAFLRTPIWLPALLAAWLPLSCSETLGNYDVECKEDVGCDAYSECVEGLCVCMPEQCPGVCAGSACVSLECGTMGNRCADADFDLCDPVADECYRSNGRCEGPADCPGFGYSAHARVCGDDGFCHYVAGPEAASLVATARELPVLEPTAGQRFEEASTTRFRWSKQPGPVVAAVIATRPMHASDLDSSIWAAFLAPGSSGVDWSQGTSPSDDGWTEPAADPPAGELYLVVVGYDGSDVVSMSRPIAFRVGSDWPGVGASCGTPDATFANCEMPDEVLACHRGFCERLCLSHVDCLGIGESRCGPGTPTRGRACERNRTSADGAPGDEGS